MFPSNFDGNDASTNTSKATGLTWTTDADVSMLDADLTAVGDTFAVLGDVSTGNNITMSTNLNSSRANARGYSFDVTSTVGFDLGDFTISSKHLNGAGGAQAFTSDLHYSITGINTTPGSVSGFLDDVAYINTSGVTYTSNIIDLSTNSLVAMDYRVTVSMSDLLGGGAFATFDGVTREATAVPESSSKALFGLGGLALLLRRRK